MKASLSEAVFKNLALIAFLLSIISYVPYGYANDITKSAKYAALVLDSKTGNVLYAKNAHEPRYPASLTKMMTLYLTFEALESGKLTMNQKILTSHKAAQQVQFKLGMQPGEKVSVKDCIYGAIILSANDSVVVLAEAIAGSEWKFAKMMTEKAKKLGMKNTNFINSHGCHDPQQYTTAADMAKLALALKKNFPKYYPLFLKTSFTFKGKVINGHNHVTRKYQGAEGLKTGYIRTSGFNLVTTAKKPYGHLVGVVFGGQTAKARDEHMINILDKGFCVLSQKGGHINPKCNSLPSYVVADNSKPKKDSESDIFSIVDEKKTTNIASFSTKKATAQKVKAQAAIAKKPAKILVANKTKKTIVSSNLRNNKPLKANNSKKTII